MIRKTKKDWVKISDNIELKWNDKNIGLACRIKETNFKDINIIELTEQEFLELIDKTKSRTYSLSGINKKVKQ